jgi:flagellar hook capping protein FlgD
MKHKITLLKFIFLILAFTFISINAQTVSLTTVDANIAEDGVSMNLTFASDNAVSTAADVTVIVTYSGTAINGGTDYTASTSVVLPTFTTANASNTISVLTVADTFLEGDQTIIATITSVVGGDGAPSIDAVNFSTTFTIIDAEYVELYTDVSSILEDSETVTYKARVSGGGTNETGGTITANVTWTHGTATNGTDFSSGPLTIDILDTDPESADQVITPSVDAFLEGDETIGAQIGSLTGAPVGTGFSGGTVSATITDAETISLSGAASIPETGGSATLTATISGGGNLALNGGGPLTLDVTYTGTATNGTDYTDVASFTIANTGLTGTFAVASISDFNIELDETVIATISTVTAGITFTDDSETVTITDDESITLIGGGGTIPETGGSATLTATIDNSGLLDLPLDAALSLNVAYSGTASNGIDYTNVASFTIADAALSGTFDIASISDSDIELDETVIATISTLSPGISFTDDNEIITILDDDFLSAPINGLTGVSVEPSFTWITPNTGGADYTIEISTAGSDQTAFDAGVIADSTLSNLTCSFEEVHTSEAFPLSNSTLYYWQVTPTGGPASEIFHFTTIPAVPITQSLPLDLATVNMTDVTFYWYISGLQGSMKYKIQVVDSLLTPTATEWTTAIFDTTTSLPYKKFSLNDGTKYYWRVVLLTAGDEVINYSSIWSFTTGGGVAITPIPSWPVNDAVVQTNTPTLYWYTSVFAGSAEYQVKYHTDATLGLLPDPLELDDGTKYPADVDMAAASGSTDLFLTTPALLAGETYYWQARTYDATTLEYGQWSVVESFVTNGTGTLVKPTPSYPTEGVTQYTTAPTLYWYIGALGDGLTYDIYYKKDSDPGFTGPVHQAVDLSYQLTGLEAGASYEWYVASNNTIDTSQSNTATFTITGGASNGYPVITWPVSNPTVYTLRPTINWFIEGSTLGLTDVELRYREGSNSTDWSLEPVGTVIPLPSTAYTFTSDLNEGSKYYFALSAIDAGSNYSVWDEDSMSIYSAAENLSDPVLTAPIGGISLATDSPILYWHVVGDHTAIASYEVSYSISDVFASPTVVPGVLDPNLALSGLTPGATYYWKVRTLFTNASYSNYSTTETFVITPGGFAIQPLVGGPNNVVVNTTSPTISWVFPADHSPTLKSELLISDNPDMMNAITIENIESSTYDVSNLEMGKSYFWRVRTKTMDNSYSEYSGQGIFKVGNNITDVAEPIIIPEKFNVSQNYPNPFNPTTIINYSLPEAEFVTIRIYNMIGQEIATLLNEEVNAGVYNVTWSGVNNSGVKVATGTYIYRVVAGSNIITKKMMLLK